MVLQAQGFRQNQHEVSVITLASQATDFHELPAGVNRTALDLASNSHNAFQALRNNLHRLRMLRRAIIATRPVVVISHVDEMNILTTLALARTRLPLIVTEHCDPTPQYRSWFWHKLRRITYPRIAKVVSVSKGVDQCFSWLSDSQRTVIHNPVAVAEDAAADARLPIELKPNQRLITAMGRLTSQKGFDLLLRAFEKIAVRHPEWQLSILGEGELRKDLERQREELGLGDRVHFAGVVAHPFPVLRRSELFVMASRFEGFPYALLEAMACGLPVIYTDCPSGPNEIIRHDYDGLLVPNEDVQALASAMDRLMSSDEDRKRLAAHAPEVIERFGCERITDLWEELLAQVVSDSQKN